MMQPTDFWNLDDLPGLSTFDCTRLRAIHVQRKMGAPVVVIAEVAPQDTPQVVLDEHDDLVEILPTDAAKTLFA